MIRDLHQRFPKTFLALASVFFLSLGSIAAYKYVENKAQSQNDLQYFGMKDGKEVFDFMELHRKSGTYYASGDLIVGGDQKLRIQNNVIDSSNIKNRSLKGEDISTGAVDSRTIDDGSIDGLDINAQADLRIRSILFGATSIIDGSLAGDWNLKSGGLSVAGDIDAKGNQIQNIGDEGTDFTSSGGLNLAGDLDMHGELKIFENSGSNYSLFKGGNQSDNITYTLPETIENGMLVNKNGVLEWDEDDYMHSHAGIDFEYPITSNSAPNAGTLNIPANSATFYTDENKDDLTHIDLAAVAVLHITDNVTNYIVADRDAQTFVALTNEDQIDYVRYLPYAEVFKREGSNVIHTQISSLMGNGEIEAHHDRVSRTDRYARESGLDGIEVNDQLEVTVTGGYVWSVNKRYEIETSTTATRQFEVVRSSTIPGGWSISSHTNPKIINDKYDNGDGFTELTNDEYYVINYIYRGIENENHMYIVYSDREYAPLEEAQASGMIGDIPDLIRSHAMLVGRVIVAKGQTSNFVIESAFTERFAGNTPVTSHHSMTGLNNDDHIQYALLAGRDGGQTFLGNMGFGITNPQYALDVKGSDDGIIARFQGSTNTTGCAIATDGTIVCSSDKNLKKNIDDIPYGLDTVMDLRPVEYNWKNESDSQIKSLGFVAQDVEKVIPKLVITDANGMKQLNTIGLVPVAIKAIQEQQDEIDALKLDIQELQKRLDILEAK